MPGWYSYKIPFQINGQIEIEAETEGEAREKFFEHDDWEIVKKASETKTVVWGNIREEVI